MSTRASDQKQWLERVYGQNTFLLDGGNNSNGMDGAVNLHE